MTHSGISRFKNIIALIVFIVFIAIEFLYVKNGNQFNNMVVLKEKNNDTNKLIETIAVNDNSNVESIENIKELENNKNVNSDDLNKNVQSIASMSFAEEKNDSDNNEIVKKKTVKYATVSEAYFENALFIGDSRTEGFRIYKDLDGATYYCNPSFGVFSGMNRTMEIPHFGLVTLGDLLYNHKFDIIYICLGINNIATDIPNHKKIYEQFLNQVKGFQPNTIIYLIANLKVTKVQDRDKNVNNKNIDLVNSFIKEFADNERVFFLDPNFLYVDEEGFIPEEISYDGCHIKAKHYDRYLEFLKGHAIIKE